MLRAEGVNFGGRQTDIGDEHVDRTDEIAGGPDEPIDGPGVGEVQIGGEHRGAASLEPGREPFTDVGAAGADQH